MGIFEIGSYLYIGVVLGSLHYGFRALYAIAHPLGCAHIIDVVSLYLGTAVRFGRGRRVAAQEAKQPQLPIKLYEYEGCPFCRRLREVVSAMALTVDVYPCPRETITQYSAAVRESRFRGEVQALGGKLSFPFMVDVNTGTLMNDSALIAHYLWDTYGEGEAEKHLKSLSSPFTLLSLMMAQAARPLNYMGILRTPSVNAARLMVLYGCESHSMTRLVREALCTLELPYTYVTLPEGSQKRDRICKEQGLSAAELPVLDDPNCNADAARTRLRGGFAAVKYLRERYKTGEPVNESLTSYSTKGATAEHGALGIHPSASNSSSKDN